MLEDILTLILGLALILFGLETMSLSSADRKYPPQVIKSVINVVGGFFLIYYWHLNTASNSI